MTESKKKLYRQTYSSASDVAKANRARLDEEAKARTNRIRSDANSGAFRRYGVMTENEWNKHNASDPAATNLANLGVKLDYNQYANDTMPMAYEYRDRQAMYDVGDYNKAKNKYDAESKFAFRHFSAPQAPDSKKYDNAREYLKSRGYTDNQIEQNAGYWKSSVDAGARHISPYKEQEAEAKAKAIENKYINFDNSTKQLLSDVYEGDTASDGNWFADALSAFAGADSSAITRRGLSLAEKGKTARQKLRDLGLTDDEITYYSILNNREINKQTAVTEATQTEQFAANHPIVATGASVLASPVSGITAIAGDVQSSNDARRLREAGYSDLGLDDNNAAYSLTRFSDNSRKAVEDNYIESDAGKFLYETGVSGLESLINAWTGLGAVSLGANAAASTARDITERGGNTSQALLGALSSGVFESLFESVSIANLRTFKNLEEVSINTVKDAVKKLAGTTFTNLTEEAATELANIIYDTAVNGNISNFAISVQNYMSQGMSEDEARLQASKDLGVQIAEAGLGGALMGAGFGIGGAALNKGVQGIAGRTISQNSAIDAGELSSIIQQRNAEAGTPISSAEADAQAKTIADYRNGKTVSNEALSAVMSNRIADNLMQETNRYSPQTGINNYLNQLSEAEEGTEYNKLGNRLQNKLNENGRLNPFDAYTSYSLAQQYAEDKANGNIKVKRNKSDIRNAVENIAKESEQNLSEEEISNITNAIEKSQNNEQLSEQEQTLLDTDVAKDVSESLKRETSVSSAIQYQLNDIEAFADRSNYVSRTDSETLAKIQKPTLADGSSVSKIVNIKDNIATVINDKGETRTIDADKIGKYIKDDISAEAWNNAITQYDTADMVDAYVKGFSGGDISNYDRNFKNAVNLAAKNFLNEDFKNAAKNAGIELENNTLDIVQNAVIDNTIAKSGVHNFAKEATLKNKSLKNHLELIDLLGKKYNLSFTIVDKLTDGNGTFNGKFEEGTNKFVLSLDADKGLITRTAGHEVYHYLKNNQDKLTFKGREALERISNLVDSLYSEDEKKAYIEKYYGNSAVYDTEEKRNEEFIADHMFDVLSSKRAIKELCNDDATSARKLAEHIRKVANTIHNFIKSVKDDKYAEFDKLNTEADKMNEIADNFFDVLNELKEVKQSQREAKTDIFGNNEISNSGDASVAHSLSRANTIGEQSTKYNDIHKIVDSKQFANGVKAMNEMANYMKPFLDKEGILPPDKEGKTIFANGSYGRTMENTTLCVRTLTYEFFKDEVSKKLGRPLTVAESLLVSQKIYDIATEPQCIYCYVAADRKAYDEYIGNYVDMQDKWIAKIREGKKSLSALKNEYLDSRNITGKARDSKTQANRWNAWVDAAKNNGEITKEDVVTRSIRQETIDNAPNSKKAWLIKDAQRYAQSASWAKKVEDYRSYKGDILKMKSEWINVLNDEYGLRMYSFSDFTPAFITENMQMLIDASARGLKSLAYTKDTDYAKIFAPTGQAINISCFARWDERFGTYVPDERQGALWSEAKALRDKYNNVGTVMVATTDKMTMWALKQDWIDVVIPYHIVKTGTTIANEYEWHNYTSESADKNGNRNDIIYPTEHNNDFATFTQIANKNGITPRFKRYYDMVATGELTGDQYMKLVNEVRLPASELSAVVPEFDLDEAKISFDKFVDKGGYQGGWFKDDVNIETEINAVASDIAEGKSSKFVNYGMNKGRNLAKNAYSTKRNATDSNGNALSEQQQEYFADSKVRDEDGNLLVVYHGTSENFTVFDRTKGRSTADIQGMFFSPWEIEASGYGDNVGAYYLNIKNPADESTAYKALRRFQGQNDAGAKARDYLESLGYDGVDNEYDEFVAFRPEQIKRTDNKNPTVNPDINYSESRETEYLELAKDPVKNEAKLNEMVKQAAKAGGFAEEAFHGSRRFGWTKPSVKNSRLGTALFVSDSYANAGEYAYSGWNEEGDGEARTIASARNYKPLEYDASAKEILNAIKSLKNNELGSKYNNAREVPASALIEANRDDIDEVIDSINKFTSYWSENTISKHLDKKGIIEDALQSNDIQKWEKLYNARSELYLYIDAYQVDSQWGDIVGKAISLAQKIVGGGIELENGNVVPVSEALKEYNDVAYADGKGVYRFYAKTGKQYVYNGAFNNFDSLKIPSEAAEWIKENYGDEKVTDTDTLAAWAKSQGYDSIKLYNIYDNVTSSSNDGAANVTAFFYPESQIKSADPVTYDDNGNIIPLSERFNEQNDDIRWSEKREQSNLSAYELSEFVSMSDELLEQKRIAEANANELNNLTEFPARKLNQNDIASVVKDLWGGLKTNISNAEQKALITELYEYIANDKDVTSDEIYRRAYTIAEKVFKNASVSTRDEHDDLVNTYGFRPGSTFAVSETAYDDLVSSGRISGLRKYMHIVKKGNHSGINLEDYMNGESELSEFEDIYTEQDALDRISDVIYAMQELEDNKYSRPMTQSEAEYYASSWALDIADKYWDVREVVTDELKNARILENAKGKDKLTQTRAKYRVMLNELKAENKREIASINLEANRRYAEYEAEAKKLNRRVSVLERKRAKLNAKVRDAIYQQVLAERRLEREKVNEGKRNDREQIRKEASKMLKKLESVDDYKHIPYALRRSVTEFLMTVSDTNAFDYKKIARLSEQYQQLGKESDDMSDASTFYDEDIAGILSGAANTINAEAKSLAERLDGKTLRTLSSSQLRDLKLVIRNVRKIINDSNKALVEGKKESLLKRKQKAFEEISKTPQNNKLRTFTGNFNFKLGMMKPTYFFDALGSKELTEAYQDIRNGENKWATVVNDAKQKITEAKKRYHYKDWSDTDLNLKLKSGKEITVSLDEALSIYATAKRTNAQGEQHLIQGGVVLENETDSFARKVIKKAKGENIYDVSSLNYRLSADDIVSLIGKLTSEQKKYADDLVEYMSNDMAKLGNEISMRMYDIKKFNESYYFPIRSAQEFIYTKQGALNGADDNRIKHMSMTKKTTPNANNPVVIGSFTDTVAQHCSDMGLYYGLSLPLEDFNRILNYKTAMPKADAEGEQRTLKQMIGYVYGKDALSYINTLINDINGSRRKDEGGRTVSKLISLVKKGAVFGSLSVAIQQPSAIGRAMALVDPKYFTSTLVEKRDYDELCRYAPVALVKQMGYFDTNVGRTAVQWMTETDYESKKEKAIALFKDKDYRDEALSWLPEKMDEITWSHIWNAVKAETADTTDLKKGTEEFYQRAAKRFTEVIDKTQVYDSVFSRSQWMRSTDTGMGVLTAFMAEPTVTANMVYSAWQSKDKAVIGRTMAAVSLAIALNALLKSIITTARHLKPDDEDSVIEAYINEFLGNMLDDANPLNYIPAVKEFVSMAQGYDSTRMDTQIFKELADTVTVWANDNKTFLEKLRKTGETIGLIRGIPIKNVLKDSEGAYNVAARMFNFAQGNGRNTTASGIGESVKDAVVSSIPFGDSILNRKYGSNTYGKLADSVLQNDVRKKEKILGDIGEEYDKSKLTKVVKERYLKGKYTVAQSRRLLMTLNGYTENQANAKIRDWAKQ